MGKDMRYRQVARRGEHIGFHLADRQRFLAFGWANGGRQQALAECSEPRVVTGEARMNKRFRLGNFSVLIILILGWRWVNVKQN